MTPSAVMSLQSSPGSVRCPVTEYFLRVAGVRSQSTARGLDPRIGYFGDFRLTPGAIAASVLIAILPAAAVYRKPGAIQTYFLWRSPSSIHWVSYEPYSP